MSTNPTARSHPAHRLGDDARYQRRRERAYNRVQALGLRRRWIARAVGRSVRCVTEVLSGTDTGAPTLALIEGLLARIEAGEVVVPDEARRRGAKRRGR